MSTIARSTLLGLFALVVTLVAVGSVAVEPVATSGQTQTWVRDVLYLPPFVAGMASAVAHPGPRAAGWRSFVISVLLAPILVQATQEGFRIDAGVPPPVWWSYLVYPALALLGALVVLALRRYIRRREAAAAAEGSGPSGPPP